MLITATCRCGNEDTRQFIDYDGALGYAAIICKACGDYQDNSGQYGADEWSRRMIGRA